MVLSGCCQALTHTSHTYDTIKRRPAGLCCTYSSLYSASGPTIFFMVDVTILVCRTERIAERQGGVLLQVHLADDLVVAGPAEGLPIVVARQLVVLARSVLVARAVCGGPVTLFTSRYHRRIKRPLASLMKTPLLLARRRRGR